jgi:hypothetical protein
MLPLILERRPKAGVTIAAARSDDTPAVCTAHRWRSLLLAGTCMMLMLRLAKMF